jgi:seryl-tRNA synthetase
MLDLAVLARDAAVLGTAHLPKFADELFCTQNGLWLIPTAEVPLTNRSSPPRSAMPRTSA